MSALAEYDMTPEQWQVMATLWSDGVLSQVQIVSLTLKDKHSVSRIIARLENKGWVKKVSNPEDARSTLVRLTQKGKGMQDEIPKRLIEQTRYIITELGEKDHQRLLSLLKKTRRILGDEC